MRKLLFLVTMLAVVCSRAVAQQSAGSGDLLRSLDAVNGDVSASVLPAGAAEEKNLARKRRKLRRLSLQRSRRLTMKKLTRQFFTATFMWMIRSSRSDAIS